MEGRSGKGRRGHEKIHIASSAAGQFAEATFDRRSKQKRNAIDDPTTLCALIRLALGRLRGAALE